MTALNTSQAQGVRRARPSCRRLQVTLALTNAECICSIYVCVSCNVDTSCAVFIVSIRVSWQRHALRDIGQHQRLRDDDWYTHTPLCPIAAVELYTGCETWLSGV